MEICKFPGCGYVADFITKAHCRLEHGIERAEVEKLYGTGNASKIKFSGKVETWIPTEEQYFQARLNGISRKTLHERGKRGWRTDEAIKVPVMTKEETAKIGASARRFNLKTGVNYLDER